MGDAGLRLLTRHISVLKLQVLVLERCGLTDASAPYIATIIKVTIVDVEDADAALFVFVANLNYSA
jgi:hypothetical protein